MKAVTLTILIACGASAGAVAQDSPAALPEAILMQGLPIEFPADVDSNSPAFWSGDLLHVFNSLHHPYLSEGRNLAGLDDPVGVLFRGGVSGPRWMESVIKAEDDTLYGFYHHEPVGLCGGDGKTAPQIGAARSRDDGFTWEDLGIILAAAQRSRRCATDNLYFVGGEGDFSAVRDQEGSYVYFAYSAYPASIDGQGIVFARMKWADRDRPSGRVIKWRAGEWTAPGLTGRGIPAPAFAAKVSWHEAGTDAFWGPSLHWNTHLQKYVMLMTRTADSSFNNSGIYIAYADRLEDPRAWSTPRLLIEGGAWYPQVMGLQRGRGTDTLAGQYARFFMGGRSDFLICFEPPASSGAAAAARQHRLD